MSIAEKLRTMADNIMYPNGKPLPASWGEEMRVAAEYTPDMYRITSASEVLVFNPDPRVIVDGPSVPAFTQSTYHVHETSKQLVLLPRPKDTQNPPPTWGRAEDSYAASVRGQLVRTASSTVPRLDMHYANGVQSERTCTWVMIPFKIGENTSVFGVAVRCYVYVGKTKYWRPLLDGGYTTRQLPALPPPVRVVTNHVVYPEAHIRKRR